MAEKQDKLNKLARDVLILSRNTLLVNLRFLDAALSQFQLFPIEESTLLTDGKYILYNPKHVLESYKTAKEIPIRDYLHIVMHCVFKHMYIDPTLNRPYWDLACDIAVENVITELGLKAVTTARERQQVQYIAAIKKELKHVTAEKIYSYLRQSIPDLKKVAEIRGLFYADNHEIWYMTATEIEARFGLPADSGQGNEEGEESSRTAMAQVWQTVAERMQVDLETFGKKRGLLPGAMTQNLASVNREKYDYTAFLKKFAVMGEAMKINDDEFDYPYVFGSYENSLMIPVSIGDLPVVKAPSKQLPEDAIVYCGADQFDKLPRPNKAIFAVQWLMKDKMLREELSDKIQVFIKKYADDVAYALKSCENVAAYQRFLEIAKPKAPLIEKLVEQCSGKTEILAVLLNSGSTAKQEPAGLSLDAKPKVTVAELKKLWTYQKLLITATDETVIELTNYKGHDKHVEIPAFIGKTRVAVVKGIFPDAVESVEFPNEEIEIKCSFRNCKAMADENGFVCVNVGGRRVVTDYVGSKDMDTLIIPEGVTETAYGVFREVHAREVILPEGFIRLAGSSFADCRKLQKVTLPESLRSIEQMVFQNCGALKQLYIPEGVSTIGILDLNRTKDPSFTIYGKRGSTAHSYAEKYGTNFVEGYPEEIAMPEFQVESGVLTGYVGNGGDVVIPADVTEIGSFAFHENKTINTLKIGYQVQMIGKYAFASCTNLTSVKICGVKAIADCAFQFSRITRVEIEEGVETIGANAFGYLSPRGAEVVIPASVLSIGKDAFYSNFNTTTLYVKAGSYAETYAKENNIPFVAE